MAQQAQVVGYSIPDYDQETAVDRFVCVPCYTHPCNDATPVTAEPGDTYFAICSRCGKQPKPTQAGVDTPRNWSTEAEFCETLLARFYDTYGVRVREGGVWLSRISEPVMTPEIQKIYASIQTYKSRCYEEVENLAHATTTCDDTDYPGGW